MGASLGKDWCYRAGEAVITDGPSAFQNAVNTVGHASQDRPASLVLGLALVLLLSTPWGFAVGRRLSVGTESPCSASELDAGSVSCDLARSAG